MHPPWQAFCPSGQVSALVLARHFLRLALFLILWQFLAAASCAAGLRIPSAPATSAPRTRRREPGTVSPFVRVSNWNSSNVPLSPAHLGGQAGRYTSHHRRARAALRHGESSVFFPGLGGRCT